MKKYKSILLIIGCALIFVGCSTFKRKFRTNNKGIYTVTFGQHESKSEDETVTIRGHVYDMKTGKPLQFAVASAGCFKFLTTIEGEYSFRTRNLKSKSFNMALSAFPYHAVETDFIDIYNRKEIIIDFYLDTDERPMFDCIQGGAHERMQNDLNNLK